MIYAIIAYALKDLYDTFSFYTFVIVPLFVAIIVAEIYF